MKEDSYTQTTNKTWTSFEGSSILMNSFYSDFRCNVCQVSFKLVLPSTHSDSETVSLSFSGKNSWYEVILMMFQTLSLSDSFLGKNCVQRFSCSKLVWRGCGKESFISSHNFYALMFTEGERLIKVPVNFHFKCKYGTRMPCNTTASRLVSWLLNTQTIPRKGQRCPCILSRGSLRERISRGSCHIMCVASLCWRVRWILLNMKVEYKLWWSERKQWLTRKKDMSYKELLSKEKRQT